MKVAICAAVERDGRIESLKEKRLRLQPFLMAVAARRVARETDSYEAVPRFLGNTEVNAFARPTDRAKRAHISRSAVKRYPYLRIFGTPTLTLMRKYTPIGAQNTGVPQPT